MPTGHLAASCPSVIGETGRELSHSWTSSGRIFVINLLGELLRRIRVFAVTLPPRVAYCVDLCVRSSCFQSRDGL
jgi:hypothetical protein